MSMYRYFWMAKNISVGSHLGLLLKRSGSICDVKIRGVRIKIRKGTPDLAVAVSAFMGEFDILRNYFPGDNGCAVVDAGGYIGTSAIVFSLMWPDALVITIEPSSENFAILEQNIAGYSNIKAVNAALAPATSQQVVLRDRHTGAWGYTVMDKPEGVGAEHALEEVSVVQLGEIWSTFGPIGLLKMDIEGAEKDVFLQDGETLSEIPVIFVELHERIVAGVEASFWQISNNRKVVVSAGEKYLSLSASLVGD